MRPLTINGRAMRILFITDNFPPETNAPATRTYEHCRAWVNAGAEVTVITCAPNFPQGRVFEGYRNRLYRKEAIDGITVIRVWSYVTANEGFAKRVLDYVSFAVMAFAAGLFQKCDVIVATSPQFFTTWAASALSKVRRRPWIFELRDLWPESIRTVGAMKQSRILDRLERIELWLYRDAARVVAVTDAFKANLVGRGIDAAKIDVVTNGANLEHYTPRPKDEALLASLGLEDKFVVGYIGTHGLAHSLDFIVRSAAKVTDPAVRFLFVGDGAMKQTVVRLARELGADNVVFHDPIPKEEVPRYLASVDVSLAPLKRSETFKTVIPSKIFEASAMGKPTLLGVEGEAQGIIETYRAGLCFRPEDEADFLAALTRLKKDSALYGTCVEGCGRLARAYDRRRLAAEMLEIIKKVAS